MKQFFLAACISMVAGVSVQAQATKKPVSKTPAKTATKAAVTPGTTLKTLNDSFSYALGLNIANNLKAQGIESVSLPVMQKAMQEIFSKKKPALDDQQANMTIQRMLQQKMTQKNAVVKNEGEAFLANNKKRAGVTTLPDGLQYEVLTKGDASSPMPKLEDTVVAHYKGTLIDGKQFDNSYDRGEPLSIAVGGVIRGWTEALQLMHKGDKWKIFIPSELGYGERGAGADIPGGATLVFEIELIDIKPAAAAPAPKADAATPQQN